MTKNIRLVTGEYLVRMHSEKDCVGRSCGIHRPSDHPLAAAPYDWDNVAFRLFRVCEHGLRHPDPDDVDFKVRVYGDNRLAVTQHECDDCCHD